MKEKHRRDKKNTRNKAFSAIFLIGVMILFSSFLASAQVSFDNVKDYDPINKEVTITNAFGLGDEIAKVKLNTPLINYVMRGNDRLVAEIEVDSLEAYEDVFNDMNFYDKNDGDRENSWREFTYKKKIINYDTVPNYVWECVITDKLNISKGGNITECDNVQKGTKQVEVVSWEEITKELGLQKEVITLGIFTDVYAEDYVEWIPTLYGVEIEEWAVWTESLNVGLVNYYNFSSKNDLLNNLDWVNNEGNPPIITAGCLIDDCINISENNNLVINQTNTNFNIGGADNMTMNFWVNPQKYHDTATDFFIGINSVWYLTLGTAGEFSGALCGGGGSWATLDIGTWYMITLVTYGGNEYCYVNGTLVSNGNGAGTSTAVTKLGTYDDSNDGDLMFDEFGVWNRTLTTSEISDLYNEGVGMTAYEVGGINSVTLNSPENNYNNSIRNITFNCTSISLFNIQNVSLMINGQRNLTVDLGAVTTYELFQPLNFSYGTYNWTCVSTNINNAQLTTGERNFTIGLKNNAETYNLTTAEMKAESFMINLTYDNTSSISANLFYNNTAYAGTQVGTGETVLFTRSLTIPLGNVSNEFYWEVLIDSIKFNTTKHSQDVSLTMLDYCNSTNTIPYLNFTFKNETLGKESITATFDTDFTYWINDVTINKTFTYTNATENTNYTFCLSPPDIGVNVLAKGDYNNAGSQQRSFNSIFSLTNTTTEKILWLLPTSDGIFVTFQVVNSADQVVVGTNATVSKDGDIVEQDFTDAAGTVTLFLNPDTVYSFIFDKEEYTSYTSSFAPTQTSYTVTLGGGITTTTPPIYIKQVNYNMKPESSYMYNDTTYSFNFTVSSTYWTITEYGFKISNTTDNLGEVSSSANGGTVNLDLDTGTNRTIVMNAYWIINDTYTNITKTWIVTLSGDTSFSVAHFFTDLSLYIGSGLFGLDSWGLTLIIFLVIFIFTGVMSYSFGLRSPETIMFMIFSLVLLFDWGLNMIPNPVGAIPHFPTIVVALILISIYLTEVKR